MDTMTVDDPTVPGLEDVYTKALSEITVAKREHREPPTEQESAQPERVLDLNAALNASAAQVRDSGVNGHVRLALPTAC
ncbi:non-homologous end joining protein Ku [Streptomyces sp. DSM 40167]|uniref:hypothetical protein n=1 Tax=unclassified Streptomyces TaxID=2593676 RepID=UPI00278855BE|nr:non-homologous end joining protein Ku [Streptomyces sp. DSM 40167]